MSHTAIFTRCFIIFKKIKCSNCFYSTINGNECVLKLELAKYYSILTQTAETAAAIPDEYRHTVICHDIKYPNTASHTRFARM